MKKTLKRVAALGLAVTSVMGLVACGDKKDENTSSEATTAKEKVTIDWSKVEKPGKLVIMVDNTVHAEDDGGAEFYVDWAKSVGLNPDDITWKRPDHSGYATNLSTAFLSDSTTPDIVLLPTDYLAQYATEGLLWDMTDAWECSNTKASGRLIDDAEKILGANYFKNDDGESRMYGFSPYRGNGCCTYVSVDWVKAAGWTVDKIEGKQLTFDEYYKLLTDMKNSGKVGEYGVISAPGLISGEAPYTNYLPEFYQNASYSFTLKDGKFVDGFQQDEMKEALKRLQKAYADGILDPICYEKAQESTSAYREKFYKGQNGVYTYWAGDWANTTKTKLAGNNLSDEILVLEPIKGLDKYVERLSPAWAITEKCENKEGAFKYFIDTMLDGGRVQTVWTFGAEGLAWSIEAEEYDPNGKGTMKTAYEGQFHFLKKPQSQATFSKNHIDQNLSLASFDSNFVLKNAAGTVSVKDKDGKEIKGNPSAAAQNAFAKENAEWFKTVSEVATQLPVTAEYNKNIGTINTQRKLTITAVVVEGKDVDAAMKEYQDEVGSKVDAVVKSLNDNLK